MTDPNCPPELTLDRLVERTAELNAIIDATSNGLLVFDAQGRLVRMNPVAERLLRVNAASGQPETAALRFAAEDGPVQAALRGDTVRDLLVCLDSGGGPAAAWVAVSAAPIHRAGAAIDGAVLTLADVTCFLQAQARAESAGQRLTTVLDSLFEAYIALARDWTILEVNQAAANIFRRPASELLGKNIWEEFPAARLTHFYDNYERAFQENQPTHFEGLSAITGRWHEVHGYPRGDRIEIYFHDITDRKLLALETNRQSEFYNALLQAAPAGICVLDGRDLRARFANPAYLRFLEEPFCSQGIVGLTLEEFVPGAREQGLVELFHQVAQTGKPHIAAEYRHEGFTRGITYWRYSLLPFYFDQAGPKDALSSSRDLMIVALEVTEQVQSRRELEALLQRAESQAAALRAQATELAAISAALDRERTRLAALVENLPVAVILAEAPSGRLALSNRRVEEIWRRPFIASPELAEYRAYVGFHADGRRYEPEEWPLARSLLMGEVVRAEEIDIERGDSTRGVLSVSSSPIYERDGRITAAVVSFTDITESKAVERALIRARDELTTLLATSQTLVSTLKLPEVLALLARELGAVIELDGIAIYLIDGEDLTVQEYVGPMPREEALRIRMPLRKTAGLWQAARDRAPVYITDLDSDAPLAHAWRAERATDQRRLAGPARSYLAVPIMVKDEPVGILRLTHNEPGRFTAEQARLATAVANQAAIAIDNARLYQQAQTAAVLEERQRLARDLHDSVSQALFGVALATHDALARWEGDLERARERVLTANQLAGAAQAEMRELIFALRPDQLATDGLVKALELRTTALQERHACDVRVSLCEEPDLPLPVKEAFYRIAQEAINNALKHARATELSVRLACAQNRVELEVSDNGQGFAPQANYPGHFGMRSMRERAAGIAASLDIESAPDHGSRIVLTYNMRQQP